MDWIAKQPSLNLPDDLSPAWPYEGFWPILEEADAAVAVKDQVEKLGPDFPSEPLESFYRLLWLLNDSERHKSLQGYIVLGQAPPPHTPSYRCHAEILMGPYDPATSQIIVDEASIEKMAAEFLERFRLAAAGFESRGLRHQIQLTPIRTLFDGLPDEELNYCLSIRIEAYADSFEEAVVEWERLIVMSVGAFEESALQSVAQV